MIGRRHYYMANVDQREEREIVESLVQQYYLDADDVPGEVLVPVAPAETPTLERWLSERHGGSVTVVVPTEGEEATLVRLAATNAKFLLDELKLQRLKRSEATPHGVQSLQKDLRLDRLPRRMECFDISNIQGTDSVASMVVFVDGKPRKSEYRKFKIRSVAGPDDFASMREVVRRRLSRLQEEQQPLPDLIVIDGGKGQLSSAVEVLRDLDLQGQPVIGLAKKLEEIFVPGRSDPEILPKASTSLRLLQRIRDEAHRFAVSYHRSLRSKRTLQTELDLIKGIGKKRAGELLEAFGSVQGVRFATVDQLADIVGTTVAERVKEYFETSEAEPEGGSKGEGRGPEAPTQKPDEAGPP